MAANDGLRILRKGRHRGLQRRHARRERVACRHFRPGRHRAETRAAEQRLPGRDRPQPPSLPEPRYGPPRVRSSENERQDADDDEQADQEDEPDGSADELEHAASPVTYVSETSGWGYCFQAGSSARSRRSTEGRGGSPAPGAVFRRAPRASDTVARALDGDPAQADAPHSRGTTSAAPSAPM